MEKARPTLLKQVRKQEIGIVFSEIIKLLNKLIGSRKAALHDSISELTAKYADALANKRDTEAARIKKQLDNLRNKSDFTGGDV